MLSSTSNTDHAILKGIAESNETAFRAIYDKYWETLYRSAFTVIKDQGNAKEVVHDVLLDLWRRRSEVSINNLEAYLKRAVRFRVINFVTRKSSPAFFEVFDNFTASPYMADNKILEEDLMALVISWINILPEKRKQIFVKYFFHQLSTLEISQELGISQKTVQNQIGTSLQMLREKYGDLLLLLYVMSN